MPAPDNSFFEELEEEISFGLPGNKKPTEIKSPLEPRGTFPVKYEARPEQKPHHHREERVAPPVHTGEHPPRRPNPPAKPVSQESHVSRPSARPERPVHEKKPSGNHQKGSESNHVIQAREQMYEAGVATIVFIVDKDSRAILGPIKLETRGLAHLHEAREIHRFIIKTARTSYEQTVMDVPDIEEKDFLKIIKKDLSRFIVQKFNRDPVIIPVIVSV